MLPTRIADCTQSRHPFLVPFLEPHSVHPPLSIENLWPDQFLWSHPVDAPRVPAPLRRLTLKRISKLLPGILSCLQCSMVREGGMVSRKISLSFLEATLTRFPKISPALKKRASRIRVLLMDVDGTMTDGGVTLLSQMDGTALEIKTFDAHDGQGLTLAHTAGIRTGCITGRESAALLRRANEMKMEFIYMKQPLKMPAYEDVLRKAEAADHEVAFVGDDLPDIPLLRRAGLAVAVGDAVSEVKDVAHYTTKALAGHGAIREAVELILRSKGIWAEMIDKARA